MVFTSVGQVKIGRHVAQRGQHAVGYRVPEVENAAPARVGEAGTVHGVGDIVHQRLEDPAVFVRVVFEVGVLDDREFAARLLQRPAHGGALAPVALEPHQPDQSRIFPHH
jgi:hypothetical protein